MSPQCIIDKSPPPVHRFCESVKKSRRRFPSTGEEGPFRFHGRGRRSLDHELPFLFLSTIEVVLWASSRSLSRGLIHVFEHASRWSRYRILIRNHSTSVRVRHMNHHVGASFTLSVLTVLFFAVVLYPPEREPPSPTSLASQSLIQT